MKKNTILYIIIIIAVAVSLLGYNYVQRNKGVDQNALPPYALRTAKITEAYEYALENRELLSHIPCYCNCTRLGHGSVAECFVKDIKDDGSIVFEEHGSACGICYSIALDAKRMAQESKSDLEIREYVDEKYSKYGRGTVTPKPE